MEVPQRMLSPNKLLTVSILMQTENDDDAFLPESADALEDAAKLLRHHLIGNMATEMYVLPSGTKIIVTGTRIEQQRSITTLKKDTV